MSVERAAVSARLAQVRSSGNPAVLRTPEAGTDALAVLCEAAPEPRRAVSVAAVADVCQTFFRRSRFSVTDWRRSVWRGAPLEDVPEDTALAAITGGYLLDRAPGLLPPELRAQLAEYPDPRRDGRFAFIVANVHSMEALIADAEDDGRKPGDGTADTDAWRPVSSSALTALDRAIAWSRHACGAFEGEVLPEEFIDVRSQRMMLLITRFDAVGDLDALAEAARDGLDLVRRYGGSSRYARCLPPAAETIVRSAYALGAPPPTEAGRAVAGLPGGTATERTAFLLRMLDAVYSEPITWAGEYDRRAGLLLAQEGANTGHPGVRAAARRRLLAALSQMPTGHPERNRTAYLATTMAWDDDTDDEVTVAAGRFLAGMGAYGMAASRLDRPGFPPEAGMAAAIIDLTMTIVADGDGPPRVRATPEWSASYDAWAARLPVDFPDRELYAGLTTALPDPEAAREVLATVVETLPWSAVAARVRDAAAGWDGETRHGALGLADEFERAMSEDTVFPRMALLLRDMHRLEASLDSREAGGGAPGNLADSIEGLRGWAKLLEQDHPEMMTVLSGMGTALLALDDNVDPETFRESITAIIRAEEHLDDEARAAGVGDVLGLAVARGFQRDPLSLIQQLFTLDQETRLMALAALSGANQRTDGERSPRIAMVSMMAELMLAMFTLIRDSDITQLDRLPALERKVTAAARDLGDDAAAEHITVLLGIFGPVMASFPVQQEAIAQGKGAEAAGERADFLRQRLAELEPGRHAHRAVQAQLALAISGHAGLLRDSDPARAAELRAEADALFTTEGSPESAAEGFRQMFKFAQTGPERASLRPANPVPPGEAGGNAEESGNDTEPADHEPESLLEVARDLSARARGIAALDGQDPGLDACEEEVEMLAQATDRGVDMRSAEHALASRSWIRPQSVIALALESALHGTAAADLMDFIVGLEEGRTALDDYVPAEAPGVVTGPLADRAAALTERARGLLVARQLEGRTDLTELREAHPGLAAEFEGLVARLNAAPDEPGPAGVTDLNAKDRARVDKYRADRELNPLIDRIRALDGFGEFLRPLRPGQMRELAADGPVVLFAYPDSRTPEAPEAWQPWAFVVTPETIDAIRIEVSVEAAATVGRRWRDAIDVITARGAARPGPARLIGAGAELTDMLSWTWHRVVGPLLDAAGLPREHAAEGHWPRIWWIPDGPFHALPLHAAQCRKPDCEEEGCGAALDAVVSSYVPSFRLLDQSRRTGVTREVPGGRPLIVASTDDDLPGAEEAARAAGGSLRASRAFIGPAATRRAVLPALARVTWAHFGCHATSDPAEPSGGLLHLPSGEQLTVREICRTRPAAARLAFLTACGTARTAERLANEAIHLSSAFLIAGFREAVGTLWEIESQDAQRVAAEFYQRVTGERPENPAVALHHCARGLRQAQPGMPHTWAAYVHAGA